MIPLGKSTDNAAYEEIINVLWLDVKLRIKPMKPYVQVCLMRLQHVRVQYLFGILTDKFNIK